ncbi:uncharacterized protein L201_005003 [Kwoniella dendrophila CBS 6074]|uniref:Uncharacterized protein n=1 Tax=Kwoniella dendrophila CBS 6074 TaxID=1295534 RepID=A0AAX4JXB1_9TREE
MATEFTGTSGMTSGFYDTMNLPWPDRIVSTRGRLLIDKSTKQYSGMNMVYNEMPDQSSDCSVGIQRLANKFPRDQGQHYLFFEPFLSGKASSSEIMKDEEMIKDTFIKNTNRLLSDMHMPNSMPGCSVKDNQHKVAIVSFKDIQSYSKNWESYLKDSKEDKLSRYGEGNELNRLKWSTKMPLTHRAITIEKNGADNEKYHIYNVYWKDISQQDWNDYQVSTGGKASEEDAPGGCTPRRQG